MPRPPAHLYKKKACPGQVAKSSPDMPSTSSVSVGLTPEQEQQFETELCWCIQQLQMALSSNKLNNKQVQDHTKALNTLMSNRAPLIKKRQVMRLSFGDYRAKMESEDKKTKTLSVQMTQAKPSQKSVFIKKSLAASGSEFRFNFQNPILKEENKELDIKEDLIKKENQVVNKSFVFHSSDNSFRFNFTSEEIVPKSS